MLANRLKILLAERDLTIKKVIEETGISRNVLSNMINKPFSNVSNANIDRLCNFLEISPSDFWVYTPWLFRYFTRPGGDVEDDNLVINSTAVMTIQAINGKIKRNTTFAFYLWKDDRIEFLDETICTVRVLYDNKDGFKELFDSLSPVFQHSIQSKIVRTASSFLESAIKNHELDPATIDGESISIDVFSNEDDDRPLFISKLTMNGLT